MAATLQELLGRSSADYTKQLVEVLGAPLVAVLGGAKDTRSVRNWATGNGPREDKVRRLRAAVQVVEVLQLRFEADMIRAWFTGMNPDLEDQSPLLILADEDDRRFQPVLLAARRFAAEK